MEIIIPVISSDNELCKQVMELVRKVSTNCEAVQLHGTQEAEEFLRIEMPELAIIDFTQPEFKAEKLIETIKSDSWLLSTSLIVICDSALQLRESGVIAGTNLLAILEKARLNKQLPQVISIISHNRHMLFHRVIGNDFGADISSAFELSNNPLEAGVFTNLLCNYLFNMNCIDAVQRDQLNFVLVELLINAIEHGNCAIPYEEKSAWLEKYSDICTLIEKKCQNPEISARKVYLQYTIKPNSSEFKITDEGSGFDWRSIKLPDIDEMTVSLHGRGIVLARELTSSLVYNEKGNEVSFKFSHQSGVMNVAPALFQDLETVEFKAGEIVFNEGEPSNFLYYIAAGVFEVLVNDQPVSVLRPDDIFLGEMSFLLNNRRSATVRAISEARLIRVSKKEFVEGIKEKPHYALFLSRLLAQRLERLNRVVGDLKL